VAFFYRTPSQIVGIEGSLSQSTSPREELDVTKYEYVQYGCGDCAPTSSLNFDCSPTLRFERLPLIGQLYTRNEQRFPQNVLYGELVKGLPIPVGVCGGIFCSYVLEHLSLEEFRVALGGTFEHLRPGGTFRLVLPDLDQCYNNDNSADAAIASCRSSGQRTQ
jgi:hypothetical protein